MAKRMLIDATHSEETRVVVVNGNRLEEFDFETSTKRQVKGNIYLAKVTRVEPSLQAAFVEYGGNRHGFLAFSEIHPDYYRIPVSDRRIIGSDLQIPEAASLEAAGEIADESGVPLEDALPEPVMVVETEASQDDASNEGHHKAGYAAGEDEAASEVGDKEPGAEAPAVETSYATTGSDAPTASSELQATASTDAEKPPSPHAGTDLEAAQPAPVRNWVAASAGDAVITSEEFGIESNGPPSGDLIAHAEEYRGPTQHQESDAGFSTAPTPAEARDRVGAVSEPPVWAAEESRGTEVLETSISARGENGGGEDSDPPVWSGNSSRDEVFGIPRPSDGEGENPEISQTRVATKGEDVESLVREAAALENGENGRHRGNQIYAPLEGENGEAEIIETLGGDEFEEVETQRPRAHRHYKIQEVIRRRQIMLVQVTKEERGNKGAALTTYLSLAGRYCVLMPNTARGGGVSRKITNLADRRRLKEILEELEIPEGMGVIVRTAGAERSKAEIKRDYEYLLRLWNEIRELTLRSTAPALIYEEGDLIKRSIRDLYTRDIDEVLVEGEEGYRTAKAFMKMLMPSHAKRVQPYRDPQIGLLHRFQVESQIDAIHSPVVQLRSGGYVVIDQTEALVAIDVNSGRSTRERNIEETALRTNLEAAEEIARQLRLRDLAGLIVIDFIDMEEHRNQGAVERRLKEALRSDRARIQVGRISPFGLLEMSRQRLRSSLTEASTQPCPHCGGTGFVRSTESTALYVLRSIEEEGMRRRSAEVCVYVPTTVALYILNHKRESLAQLEARYGIHVLVARDDSLIPPAFRLERLRAIEPGETAVAVAPPLTQAPHVDEDEADEDLDEMDEVEDAEQPERDGDEERVRARRRRRRRRRHEDDRNRPPPTNGDEEAEEPPVPQVAITALEGEGEQEGEEEDGEAERLRRRRGRRGGRRRGRRDESVGSGVEIARAAADSIEIVPIDGEGSGDRSFGYDERDATPSAEEEVSAEAAAPEPAWTLAATEIETASLPALAGEGAPDVHPAPAVEPPEPPSFAAELPELLVEPAAPQEIPPYAAPGAEIVGDGSTAPTKTEGVAPVSAEVAKPGQLDEQNSAAVHAVVEPAFAQDISSATGGVVPVSAEVAEPDQPNEQNSVAVHAVVESAFAQDTSSVSAEAEPAPATQQEPALLVQEVTKKPENPRRGWWQRLIQS
jgi:ribonuclease E